MRTFGSLRLQIEGDREFCSTILFYLTLLPTIYTAQYYQFHSTQSTGHQAPRTTTYLSSYARRKTKTVISHFAELLRAICATPHDLTSTILPIIPQMINVPSSVSHDSVFKKSYDTKDQGRSVLTLQSFYSLPPPHTI